MFQVRDTGVGKSQTPKQSPKPSRQQLRIQHAFCSLDKFCIIRKHTWVLVSFNHLRDIWNTECKHLHSLIQAASLPTSLRCSELNISRHEPVKPCTEEQVMHKRRVTNDESLFAEGWIYFLGQNLLPYSTGSSKTAVENLPEHPETHMSKTFVIYPPGLLLVKLAAPRLNSTQSVYRSSGAA